MFRKPAPPHHPTLHLRDPLPDSVDAGTAIAITVRATCPSGCDLRGLAVQVKSGAETLATGELVGFENGVSETDEIFVPTPVEVGEHTMIVALAGGTTSGARHEEAELPISVTTRPHLTSLAAWGLPSPLLTGLRFEAQVGARCSAGCVLGGTGVVVRDATGAEIARATLGDIPLAGTDALYWATIELAAPEREGPVSWSVACEPTAAGLAHAAATATFSAVAAAPPEHTVTVRVTDQATGSPLEGVRVLVAAHRGVTDASGIARVPAATGAYNLVARKPEFFESNRAIHVAADLTVEVALEAEPPKFEYDDWR